MPFGYTISFVAADMLPMAPDAVNLPKPAFFELETTTEEGASAGADSYPVSIDEGEESHFSKMASPYMNNQFLGRVSAGRCCEWR